ncbi:MAG TPA: hypothetical protein VF067_03300 [Sphingomicrobium sp.]
MGGKKSNFAELRDKLGGLEANEKLIGLAIAVLAIASFALRAYIYSGLTLWLDESWTAVLSAAPTFRSFVHEIGLDVNAPLYYFLMWLWPFESDLGLRIPSVVFTIGALAVAACWPPIERPRALFWSATLILWAPGLGLLFDARYYALLLLLCTAQTIAFARLIANPDLRRATIWSVLCTLAVVTFYYAAIPAFVQGVYYLIRFRRRALRTWPAILATLPAFGSLAFQWARLTRYATPGSAPFPKFDWTAAVDLLTWPLGGTIFGGAILLLAFLLQERQTVREPIVATAATALLATALLVMAAMAAPVVTPRYLIPMAPPLLFFVAATARKLAFLPIAFLMFLSTIWAAMEYHLAERANFGLEKPAALTPSGLTVTWMIDYQGTQGLNRLQMEEILRDGYRRNGKVVNARWGTDFESGDALILLDRGSDGTPLPIPGWPCRSLAGWGHETLVCIRDGRFTGTQRE